MNLYERLILKDNSFFKKLTAKQKQQYIYICGHVHVSEWIANSMVDIMPMCIILSLNITVVIINLFSSIIFSDNLYTYILRYTTMPIVTFITAIYCYIIYKWIIRKKDIETIAYKLSEKIQNLNLLKGKVISNRDWIYIRNNYKDYYYDYRSAKCSGKCFDTVYRIANILEDPNIYIVWMSVGVLEKKFGHAVLMKNDYIYDSNYRKTYRKSKYLNSYNAEIFKIFSINEYLEANIYKTIHWNNFDIWCRQRNAVRSKD